MKMKSQRKIERDRAKRDPRSRLRDSYPGAATADDDDTELGVHVDLAVARSLMGYDE